MSPIEAFNLFQHLSRYRVRYIVIGGHAVNFHGYVRTTEDHDIIFLRTPENEIALFDALTAIHAHWISDETDPDTGMEKPHPVTLAYIRQNHLLMLMTDHGFLDIFDYIPGFPETPVENLYADNVMSDGIGYVSLTWLRKIKSAAARPQDIIDLANLPDPKGS